VLFVQTELSPLNLWFHPREFLHSEKVKAITELPQPQTIRKVRSFRGLATFYHHFIRNFSAIETSITDCLKNEEFQWTHAATKAFKEVKRLMTQAPYMHLPDFSKGD